jgi:hypothetical protein
LAKGGLVDIATDAARMRKCRTAERLLVEERCDMAREAGVIEPS